MFGSQILDVAIGLVLLYLLIGLITSALNEWIAHVMGLRASTLEQGIRKLLNDPDGQTFVEKLYRHPLIQGISPTRGWGPVPPHPSYIPARDFAFALLDVVAPTNSRSQD